jgi:hypothetical protein
MWHGLVVAFLLTGCAERSLEVPMISQASDLSQPPADLAVVDSVGSCPAIAPTNGSACFPDGLICGGYGCAVGVCQCSDNEWKCQPGLC